MKNLIHSVPILIEFLLAISLHGFRPYLCGMKWFAACFAAWILLMSCVPCADNLISCETESACDHSEKSEDEHEADLCSPFCACTCCTSLIFNPIIDLSNKAKLYHILNPHHALPPLFELINRHWQPPRF
ncbi:MAG: hypothetical protein IPJ74_19335 [Saprospiraceae bacterium]|nr:hypothetical protein [Saprospiraceae bacterium]